MGIFALIFAAIGVLFFIGGLFAKAFDSAERRDAARRNNRY